MRIAAAQHLAQAGPQIAGAARPVPGLIALPGSAGVPGAGPPLGIDLVRQGIVAAGDLMRAFAGTGRGTPASLPRLLRSQKLADDRVLAQALARRSGTCTLDPAVTRPDPRLIDALGADRCVQIGCLPWSRAGSVTLVATTDPQAAAAHRLELEARMGGPIALAVLAEADLDDALAKARRASLRRAAEHSVPAAESCRDWDSRRLAAVAAICLALAVAGAMLAPLVLVLGLLALLLTTLIVSTGLRLAAAIAARRLPARVVLSDDEPGKLPVISILVPMFREPDIAPRLVRRLGALDWPRDRLDVLLVVEEDDLLTRDALALCPLPGWMRVIPVPPAPLRTKPRALNYALTFARGTLIGVYDAEDAPERGQLHAVARAFAAGGPDLACVQGVLDYYNPDSNWMARCFTIEYAAWFRLILPGFARLGLVVPLGGTTLFFRRDILTALGGWDAHNVTEDADLGVRLARRGYRTELISAATMEEANCRVLPWIKQRSRWLKGYAMTYLVHMRDPVRLWRDLGTWRFFGLQVLFLGTLIQFLLAPIFWSLWLLALGLDMALMQALPIWTGPATLAILLLAEVVGMTINLLALNAPRHRHLRPWVVTLGAYFPLATIAAYKAAWEMLTCPFYWDKTDHGVDDAGHRPLQNLG
jgi:glycosyltransferase XagB